MARSKSKVSLKFETRKINSIVRRLEAADNVKIQAGHFGNKPHPNGNGWFNVGVVHFKNSDVGKELLSWWADAVLHKKYPELATCGDQKYLDAFLEHAENIFIDGNIGHGAPWHWQLYDYSSYFEDGCITWKGEKQKLIFSHFSDFEANMQDNTYTALSGITAALDAGITGATKQV